LFIVFGVGFVLFCLYVALSAGFCIAVFAVGCLWFICVVFVLGLLMVVGLLRWLVACLFCL